MKNLLILLFNAIVKWLAKFIQVNFLTKIWLNFSIAITYCRVRLASSDKINRNFHVVNSHRRLSSERKEIKFVINIDAWIINRKSSVKFIPECKPDRSLYHFHLALSNLFFRLILIFSWSHNFLLYKVSIKFFINIFIHVLPLFLMSYYVTLPSFTIFSSLNLVSRLRFLRITFFTIYNTHYLFGYHFLFLILSDCFTYWKMHFLRFTEKVKYSLHFFIFSLFFIVG